MFLKFNSLFALNSIESRTSCVLHYIDSTDFYLIQS